MKKSVLIPSYNSAETIEATLDSVFSQTVPADEVIVLLDGSTDDTEARVAKFGARVRLLKQENRGVAPSRNRLVEAARGELLAFVDADDLWHPKYLEAQCQMLSRHANALAGFTGHERFLGTDHAWNQPPVFDLEKTQLLDQVTFFTRYNVETAVFGSMSYTAVTRRAFELMGPEPFSANLKVAEDSYLCYQLALLGPVVFNPAPLVAYRLRSGSLSEMRLRNTGIWTSAFEQLQARYQSHETKRLGKVFSLFYAQKRREYAKFLMGAGRVTEARQQLRQSLAICQSPVSLAKGTALLALGALPRPLQPAWPGPNRKMEGAKPNALGAVKVSSTKARTE